MGRYGLQQGGLLIVLNGIETPDAEPFQQLLNILLIVLNGIETKYDDCLISDDGILLIVLNGIETYKSVARRCRGNPF